MAKDIQRAISDGRVILTDLRTSTLHGAESMTPLKMSRLMKRLEQGLATLEQTKKQSFLAKVKDALIEDHSDREREAVYKDVVDTTFQLRLCKRCQCPDCAFMYPVCQCEGCLFGARLVSCSKALGEGLEVRIMEPGVATIGGEPVIKTEFDRKNRVTAVTVRQHTGVERRFIHNLNNP